MFGWSLSQLRLVALGTGAACRYVSLDAYGANDADSPGGGPYGAGLADGAESE